MKARRPPAAATWLLDRLGYLGDNPAFAGDLLEEFESGRTSRWYWRQALTAIVRGPFRNGAGQLYCLALLAAAVAEFPAGSALWRSHLLHLNGIAWTIGGLVALALLLPALWFPERKLGGKNLRAVIWTGGGDRRQRALYLASKFLANFLVFFWADCIACVIHAAQSVNTLAIFHVYWLIELSPGLFLELSPTCLSSHAKTPFDQLPSHELSLPVTLPGGRTFVLRPDNLVETLLAPGDPRLGRALYRVRSLDLLRRAIWLGCARNYQADLMGDSPVLSLSGLMLLIQEAARNEKLDEVVAIPLPGEVEGIGHDVVGVKA